VQLDPIKPTLKPPGSKRLNLKCADLVSSFAFNFNLRRYIKAHNCIIYNVVDDSEEGLILVWRWRFTLSNPRRKRLDLSA
jgi:hypothetical protein